jgi:hypothetical protein
MWDQGKASSSWRKGQESDECLHAGPFTLDSSPNHVRLLCHICTMAHTWAQLWSLLSPPSLQPAPKKEDPCTLFTLSS